MSEAKTIKEAKHIADMAEATRVYGKRIEASIETVNQAAELRIAAETLLGQMLSQTEKAKGGEHYKTTGRSHQPVEPTLREIGVSKDLSSRAQKLASVPPEKIAAAIDEQKREGVEITTAATLKRAMPGAPVVLTPADERETLK